MFRFITPTYMGIWYYFRNIWKPGQINHANVLQCTIGTQKGLCYVGNMTDTDPKNDAKAQYLRESAERALKEAAERRAAIDAAAEAIKGERDGPKRLEPTRFGDWEKKGIASDF